MELALSIALIALGSALTFLVVLQGRNAGLQSNDASSIYKTKRGLEKTIFQLTIVLGVLFLIVAVIASLPIFGTTATPAAGLMLW
ncbi:MAG: preprotein translocase subunit SecG [Roseiflexaceae bacterium]|jgi:preprotein translocase subunit SecG|nr:MAG: preprotein translocase subunit SecG [Chloroflexota bacterium]RLT32986.1 MAG: preprotein translocase subunit SecG [Chloroflexota bacterium]